MSRVLLTHAESQPRWGRLGNLLWVLLVTLLLWVYADLEFTGEMELTVTVRFTAGASENVFLLSKKEHVIDFKITGSRYRLERFRTEITKRGNTIDYDPAADYEVSAEPRPVSSAELITRGATAADLPVEGLTIHGCKPDTVALWLDGIRKKENLPVRLNYRGAELSSPPRTGEVTVMVPSSRWEAVETRLKTDEFALKTVPVDLSKYKPGKHEVTAEVNPIIEDIKVTVVPRTLTYEVEIANPVSTAEIQVRVGLLTPWKWGSLDDATWRDYVLVRSPDSNWRPVLEVSGSEKYLKPENVRAYIVLAEEDKKPVESWLEREVTVSFPPGSGLQLLSPAPKVKFRLQKRSMIPEELGG